MKLGAFDYMLKDLDATRRRDEYLGDPPPTGGGGPSRVVINIDLTPQPRARRRVPFWVKVVWAGIVALALASAVHAQPVHYEHWNDTNGRHGDVMTQGDATTWTEYDRAGRSFTCHRYVAGNDAQTTCH